MDELFWFLQRKGLSKTRENVYIMTAVTGGPRRIASFDAARNKSAERLRRISDNAPETEKYCTDGNLTCLGVIFPGKHVRNVRNKKDTYTAEGVNADLRHYIPIPARRSRCSARKLETLQAAAAVFAEAYNKFGAAKYDRRLRNPGKCCPLALIDFV